MSETRKIKDIENPIEEFEKLTKRFKLLQDRLLAVAMDYKFYIKGDFSANDEIYELRDNVLYRLFSARFHLQLLLEHHHRIEISLEDLYKKEPKEFFDIGFKLSSIKEGATKEVYSLFDSMIYHLSSIFDYLAKLISFIHGQDPMINPKWNKLIQDRNIESNCFCSSEVLSIIQKSDKDFVYPLIKHRSELIHTKGDMGGFHIKFNLSGSKFKTNCFATKQFIKQFPRIVLINENYDFTIKYSALWLIDNTIKTTTEILFGLSDDMKRNRKAPNGLMMGMLGKDGTIESPGVGYWGDRMTC